MRIIIFCRVLNSGSLVNCESFSKCGKGILVINEINQVPGIEIDKVSFDSKKEAFHNLFEAVPIRIQGGILEVNLNTDNKISIYYQIRGSIQLNDFRSILSDRCKNIMENKILDISLETYLRICVPVKPFS